jgi:hypothetical protein
MQCNRTLTQSPPILKQRSAVCDHQLDMAADFTPPSTEGKPYVPQWDPPPATKEPLDWANLHTIDLSILDSSNPKDVDDLVQLTKKAIQEDGFLYLVNYGVTLEQLHRQFSLAQYLHRNISEEDKERLLWDPGSGLFAGYAASSSNRSDDTDL